MRRRFHLCLLHGHVRVHGHSRVLLVVLLLLLLSYNGCHSKEDLYHILGVRRSASAKEIKSAYRRKALDTHPDKNRHVPPEQAAQEFQRVVHAFEVLSDVQARKIYDATGRAGSSTSTGSTGGGSSTHFHYSSGRRTTTTTPRKTQGRRTRPLKEQFKVKEAQSRVLHVTSLQALRDIMLQDEEVTVTTSEEIIEERPTETLMDNATTTIKRKITVRKVYEKTFTTIHKIVERHLLMVFTTPGTMEKIVDDLIVFPYPFAALSQQGIWWEEFLQTVKVRFHDPTALTRYFHIPHRDDMTVPIFIFVKRGHTLQDSTRLETRRRDQFTSWVWDQLQAEIEFVNTHDHPVEIWWVHEQRQLLQSTLESHQIATISCRLSHTFWIRDARVNQHLSELQRLSLDKLSENSTLQTFQVVTDDPTHLKFTIAIAGCFDLATNCDGSICVRADPKAVTYRQQYCRKTCGWCSVHDDIRLRRERETCQNYKGSGICRAWARQGECQGNEQYMRLNCPLACNFCTPGQDDDNNDKHHDHSNIENATHDKLKRRYKKKNQRETQQQQQRHKESKKTKRKRKSSDSRDSDDEEDFPTDSGSSDSDDEAFDRRDSSDDDDHHDGADHDEL